MRKKITLLFLLLVGFCATAQTLNVKGIVKDAKTGDPLPGVSIIIKGTVVGTETDFDGLYSLSKVDKGVTLVFNYLGYAIKEVMVNSKTLDVSLEESAESLDEIVVIGYGTQKVTNVSGAISTIKSASIEKLKPLRVEEALQGSASGVSVIQGGSPGSKPTVLIRGIPSFSGTDPVVIIDGVPQSLDDLNSINSSDIQSLNILKDAASTAIYGVKGGNGVIVVTTKGGKKNQKVEFNLSTYTGFQSVIKKIGLLNASEYAAMANEGSTAAGGGLIFPNISNLGKGTDWQDEIFKDASVTSHTFSARGGSENIGYFFSTGYLSQGGVVGGDEKSNFNRVNFTANIDVQLTPKLKFILNTSYANIKSKSVAENSFNSILGNAINFDPTVSVYNNDQNDFATYGYSNLILSEIFNPIQRLDDTYNENNGDKLYGKFELQYDILENLKITSRFGYTKWDNVSKSFSPLAYYGPNNVSSQYLPDGTVDMQDILDKDGEVEATIPLFHNSVSETEESNFSYTFETFLSYNFKLQEKHNFDVVLGLSRSKSTGDEIGTTRQDVRDNSWAWADITAATGVNTKYITDAYTGYSSQDLERRNMSFFSRVNYDFNDKYLASFSARRDGSIAFGNDNKFANFYAGSLGWVISNEDFFSSEAVNLLKLRGSYGTVGNENVDPQYVGITVGGPSYNSTANSNGYTFGSDFVSGATVNSFNNPTLSWEEQTQYNIGFDARIFNSLSITADYFNKSVDGLLFTDAPPLFAGTSEPVTSNIGSTESKGIDLTLSYNISKEDFTFNTSLTFTSSDNLVTETNSDGTAFVSGGSYFNGQSHDATRFEKGFSPGYFYGFKTNGLFQNQAEIDVLNTDTNGDGAIDSNDAKYQPGAEPGDIRYVDTNNDGIINDDDKTNIGDPFADFTLGWNLGFEYKNFDLSMFTYASVGNDIFRAYERNALYTNKDRSILDRWTGEGTTNDAKNPRYTFADTNSNIRPSDRYVEDGSFIKIKSLIFGYTLPESSNKFFSKIRVYAQAKNILTLTDYTGLDPEISGGILDTGIDRGAYPQARTFLIGLDLKF